MLWLMILIIKKKKKKKKMVDDLIIPGAPNVQVLSAIYPCIFVLEIINIMIYFFLIK